MLGQDIDAGTWRTLMFRSRLIVIFITLLIAVILIGFFMVRQRDLETAARITASEERYRVLVEGSPNAVCLLDQAGAWLPSIRQAPHLSANLPPECSAGV